MATEKNNIKKLGIIEINVLENGTGLMKDETNLTFVNCPFPKLTNSTEMFMGCSNLQTFASNLPKLSEVNTFTDMFKNADSLTGFQCGNSTTFTSNSLGVTTTGREFIDGAGINQNIKSFEVNIPNVTDTGSEDGGYMFYTSSASFISLESVDFKMDNVTTAMNMFRGCTNLKNVKIEMPKLIKGNHMFRDCPLLNNNNMQLGNFNNSVEDGLAMFQGTGLTEIPWSFPNLKRCRQMFRETQISGHLSLDMKTQFPNVSKANWGTWPAAQMFSYCPITSLDFDVSSLDEGISMFAYCDQLTTCTGAIFQQMGEYQSMFTESKFDLDSALKIFTAAKDAKVKSLHIGISEQLTDNHPFVLEHDLEIYDNDPNQWTTKKDKDYNVIFRCNSGEAQTTSFDNEEIHPPII